MESKPRCRPRLRGDGKASSIFYDEDRPNLVYVSGSPSWIGPIFLSAFQPVADETRPESLTTRFSGKALLTERHADAGAETRLQVGTDLSGRVEHAASGEGEQQDGSKQNCPPLHGCAAEGDGVD